MKKWIISGFFYFIMITIIGIILRWKTITPILPDFQFMNLVHAHSHVAFLGWVFFILAGILIKLTMPPAIWGSKRLNVLFILLHISVLGMLISFSLQGYGMFSILFSTIHIFLSYYFAYLYFTNQRNHLHLIVKRSFHAGVFFNLLSSIGPWGLAIGGMTGNQQPEVFSLFIYLYLHLQYNGWFTFIAIGLAYWLIEQALSAHSIHLAKKQHLFLVISVIPTYIASVMWFDLSVFWISLGIIGAVCQFIGISLFLRLVFKPLLQGEKEIWAKLFLLLSLLSLGIKSCLELVGSWPSMASMIYDNRQIIIGYLHLTLLGAISSFLIYVLIKKSGNLEPGIPLLSASSFLFVGGTVMMIFLLFLAGLFQWLHLPIQTWMSTTLLLSSLIIGLGILGLTPAIVKR